MLGKKVAIWIAEGQPEKEAPLVKGPSGFCTADFGWGPLDTETPNLLFDANTAVRRRPASEVNLKPAAIQKCKKKPKFSHARPDAGSEEEAEAAEEESVNVEEQEEHGPPYCKRMHCVVVRLVGGWVGVRSVLGAGQIHI